MQVKENINPLTDIKMSSTNKDDLPKDSVEKFIDSIWPSVFAYSEEMKGKPYDNKANPYVRLNRLSMEDIRNATQSIRSPLSQPVNVLLSDDEMPDLELIWGLNGKSSKKIPKEENVDTEVLQKIPNIKKGCTNITSNTEKIIEPVKSLGTDDTKEKMRRLITECTSKWTENDWNQDKASVKNSEIASPSTSNKTGLPTFKARVNPFARLKGSSGNNLVTEPKEKIADAKRKNCPEIKTVGKRSKISQDTYEKLFEEKRKLVQNRISHKRDNNATRRNLVVIPKDVIDSYNIPQPPTQTLGKMCPKITKDLTMDETGHKSYSSIDLYSHLKADRNIITPLPELPSTSSNPRDFVTFDLKSTECIDLPELTTPSSQTFDEGDLMNLANESSGLFSNTNLNLTELAAKASDTLSVMMLADKSSQTNKITKCTIGTQTTTTSYEDSATKKIKKTVNGCSQTSAVVLTGENYNRGLFDVIAEENILSDLPESENPLNDLFNTMQVVQSMSERSQAYRDCIENERDNVTRQVRALYDAKLDSIGVELRKHTSLYLKIMQAASKKNFLEDESCLSLRQEINDSINPYRNHNRKERLDKNDVANETGNILEKASIQSCTSVIIKNAPSVEMADSPSIPEVGQVDSPIPLSEGDSNSSYAPPSMSEGDSLSNQSRCDSRGPYSDSAASRDSTATSGDCEWNKDVLQHTQEKATPTIKSTKSKRIGIIAAASVSNFGKRDKVETSAMKSLKATQTTEKVTKAEQGRKTLSTTSCSTKPIIVEKDPPILSQLLHEGNAHKQQQSSEYQDKRNFNSSAPASHSIVGKLPAKGNKGKLVLNKSDTKSTAVVRYGWNLGHSKVAAASDFNSQQTAINSTGTSSTQGKERRIIPQIVAAPSSSRSMPILSSSGSLQLQNQKLITPTTFKPRPAPQLINYAARPVLAPGPQRLPVIFPNNTVRQQPPSLKNNNQQRIDGSGQQRRFIAPNNQQRMGFRPLSVSANNDKCNPSHYPSMQKDIIQIPSPSQLQSTIASPYLQQLSSLNNYAPQATYNPQLSQPNQQLIMISGNQQTPMGNINNQLRGGPSQTSNLYGTHGINHHSAVGIHQPPSPADTQNIVIQSVNSISETDFQASQSTPVNDQLPSYSQAVTFQQQPGHPQLASNHVPQQMYRTSNSHLVFPGQSTNSQILFANSLPNGNSSVHGQSSGNEHAQSDMIVLNNPDLENCEDIIPITCFLCGIDAQFTCCGPFKYCSEDCREQDSERHKAECQARK